MRGQFFDKTSLALFCLTSKNFPVPSDFPTSDDWTSNYRAGKFCDYGVLFQNKRNTTNPKMVGGWAGGRTGKASPFSFQWIAAHMIWVENVKLFTITQGCVYILYMSTVRSSQHACTFRVAGNKAHPLSCTMLTFSLSRFQPMISRSEWAATPDSHKEITALQRS